MGIYSASHRRTFRLASDIAALPFRRIWGFARYSQHGTTQISSSKGGFTCHRQFAADDEQDKENKRLCRWLQAIRNPLFCFEQALIALCVSQKFLAFRSRLMFFRRI